MEVARLSVSFSIAVQHAKNCLGGPKHVFKSKQVDVFGALYQDKDYFVLLPSGYGKSLCYQLLPFLFNHKRGRNSAPKAMLSVVIIVYPLVSLMIDQVMRLLSCGISAAIQRKNSGVEKITLQRRRNYDWSVSLFL